MSGLGITMHPSVKNLESVVKRVRDVLRKGDGITDMDSMAHCVLFTAARMLDTTTAAKLNVPYTWDTVISKVLTKDINAADKAFKDILEVLDSKFSTNEFTWKLKVQDDFEKIVKLFNELDIHEVAKHTDVLGFIYEQHISTGSGGGRDLGKFYTDRQITRYLTELLGSDITGGRPDSMCDATMGTGGFILSYIEYVTKMCPEVKWDDYDLAGGDIDDKVAAIARLNVFLRTGKLFPMIRKRNTLKNDIGDSSDKRKTFKRLLMNIPFGVKGLTLADDCCERIKEIVKAGTKSEPLFMTLTCQLLAEGGKAAVIVPDGVLVNCSKQHDTFRQYLLDNFKVLRIIKMRGKFFMNTGIQPSVIVFERSGKTDVVEFWDVEKVASGELVETYMLKVSRDKFDSSCSFDLRRYQEVKSLSKNSSFTIIKLGDLVDTVAGKSLTPEEQDENPGPYPVVSGGREPSKTYYQFNRDENTISVSKFGSYAGFIRWNSTKYWALGAMTLVIKNKDICIDKYLYYYLSINNNILYERQRKGPTTNFYWVDVADIQLQLPSLRIQQEIVESLDLIYNNAATAKATASSIKTQMAAVMRSVGARGYEKKKLSEACNISKGRRNLDGKDTGYPYQDVAKISRLVENYILEGPAILTPRAMSIGRFVYTEEKCHPSDDMFIIKPNDDIIPLYAYHYCSLLCVGDIKSSIHGVKPTIDYSAFDRIYMVIPPLPIQQEVLAMLSEMEAELKVMEQMAAKAEQRAKYILDGYLSVAVVSEPMASEPVVSEPMAIPTNTLVTTETPKVVRRVLGKKK